MAALLAAHADAPLPPALTDAIVARSEGNPFFAEELIAAAGDLNSALPTGLRDLLLQRVARLDRPTQSLLRLAAAAGRDVGYPLLRATAQLPERTVRESLRQAVEHGVLVADQAGGSFRFRHALLAEAIYATILPGEREELHARLADELARSGAAAAAELAPHWAAAGRTTEAFVASIEAARQAEAVFGLAEALAHLERALTLWDDGAGRGRARWARPRRTLLVDSRARQPDGRRRARGRARPAGDRARRRRRPAPCGAPPCSPRGVPATRPAVSTRYSPRSSARSSSCRRSRPRRSAPYALGSLAGGVDGGLAPCGVVADRRAGARARSRCRRRRGRGPSTHGARLRPRLPRPGEEGLAYFRQALQLAEEIGDRIGLERAYVQSHRRADDAGTAPGVGATGAGGTRGDAPVRD